MSIFGMADRILTTCGDDPNRRPLGHRAPVVS